MKAINLKTEYLCEPIGIDIIKPRFYWNCADGAAQTAYRIVAERDSRTIWDSGQVESGHMTHIRYGGEELKSRDIVVWRVRLWDENGNGGEWTESFFEIGLLEAEDWSAKWISGNYRPKNNTRYPADYFCKIFHVGKPLKKARLYASACGIYTAGLNGDAVSDFCLAPGATDYRVRLQYQTYDVTDSLKQGENELTFVLADGWYRGSIGCFAPTNVFGRQTRLLSQLEIVYADDTAETIISDDSFRWSNDGPLRFADLKDGEIYDATLQPSFDGQALETAAELRLSASNNVVPKEKESFTARLITTKSGKKVLDFGQNIAGLVSFKIRGGKGQKITMLCGESLDKDGEFTQAHFQSIRPVRGYNKLKEILLMAGKRGWIRGGLVPTPLQRIEFICSGGADSYKMAYSVFGFRYMLIESDISFDPADFEAIAVYSDMEMAGDFTCSNSSVNRFYQNTVWSMKGNFLDVPTDCPTRERLAWTGDGQVFFETAAYIASVAPIYRKWLHDIADNQYQDGRISAVAPYNGFEMLYKSTGTSAGWADAAILLPYRFWKRYGDEDILRDFYPMMRKIAMYMIKNTGQKNKKQARKNPFSKYTYEKGVQLGEWLEPAEFRDRPGDMKVLHTEVCTAYLCHSMTCMRRIAECLRMSEDAILYGEYAEGAKKAYNYLFVQNGNIDTDRQAKLVRPLALGLLDGEVRRCVGERLVKAIENGDYTIGTGFLSTAFVLPVLTEAGYIDIAYRVLENEKSPGWLAQVKAGATTVWESWEGIDADGAVASLNHYSPGSMCEWLYSTVGGIKPDGERHFSIKPMPGGTLTFAETSYDSIYGRVRCRWEPGTDGIRYSVEIPPNTSASIILPGEKVKKVSAGVYHF